MRRVGATSGAVAALVGVAELADWAARRGATTTPAGDGVVVVLGFPGTNAVGRAVQRWRVEMAVRAHRALGTSRVVFTGGVPRSSVSEASEMAAMARDLGLGDHEIVLEERSVSTWENIAFAAPLVGGAAYVVLVSDGVHAWRAKGYWHRQHPTSSPDVIVDPAYRFLDHVWLNVPSTYANAARAVKERLRYR